ncbi:MAG: methylmalonyl Co-A mutase-associated GTPase MeaB [Halobacteriovoraceae bacterium]|nr:methylmalonyl Co-A mutase-associated GTPase MeaB [Halobacteriovoraceae bacterium]
MKNKIDIDQLLKGNRSSLAKAITLVESKRPSDRVEAQKLIDQILPHTGRSIRIGISGSPGVGKSTFIESIGLHILEKEKKIAVLTVDPSSPVSGGSILGDKTRMEKLSRKSDVFIRPSPSSGASGGVTQKSRETILLCEAAGFDVIIVETVGVGQNEVSVSNMVDFFLVMLLPNAGDELQGIKKGIIEIADALAINKADGDTINVAQKTKSQYESALKLLVPHSFWKQQVITCSAIESKNIDKAWDMICEFQQTSKSGGFFQQRRAQQSKDWMWSLIRDSIEIELKSRPELTKIIPELEEMVTKELKTPQMAASEVVKKFFLN